MTRFARSEDRRAAGERSNREIMGRQGDHRSRPSSPDIERQLRRECLEVLQSLVSAASAQAGQDSAFRLGIESDGCAGRDVDGRRRSRHHQKSLRRRPAISGDGTKMRTSPSQPGGLHAGTS